MTLPTPPHPEAGAGVALALAARTTLVTGATSGIGRELARRLAHSGAKVLVGARELAKAERAMREIGGHGRPAVADLSSQQAVEALASRLAAEEPPLDLLFLNAGIFNVSFALTAEGHEATMAANYLGHFRLVHELARRGRLAPDGRVVVTQSEAVTRNPFARAELADLEPARLGNLARRLWRWRGSPDSKVFLALMMVEWRRRVAGTALAETTFVAADPGPTITANVGQVGRLGRWIFEAGARRFFRTAAEAVGPLLLAATAPGLATGTLLDRHGEPARLSRRASDPQLARRMWEATERALGLPPFAAG